MEDSAAYHRIIAVLLLVLVIAVIWQCGAASAPKTTSQFSGYAERSAGPGEYERGAPRFRTDYDPDSLRACAHCGADYSGYRDCPECHRGGDRPPWSSIGADRVGASIGPGRSVSLRYDDGLPASWDLPDTPYADHGNDHWGGDGTGPVPMSARIWSRAEPDHLPLTN